MFYDNSTVVAYVKNMGGNRIPELLIPFGNFACCLTVPLKHYDVQTVALDSLVSAQRSQALTALTLKDISVSENGTRFCVSKTSRPGKSSTPIMVPKNMSNGRLCPHTTFQTCIRLTESVSVK